MSISTETSSDIESSNLMQIDLMLEYSIETGKPVIYWIENFSERFRNIWNVSDNHSKEYITSSLYVNEVLSSTKRKVATIH